MTAVQWAVVVLLGVVTWVVILAPIYYRGVPGP